MNFSMRGTTKTVNLMRKFCKDTSGVTATVFAVTAMPLVLVSGVAIDFDRVVSARTSLQAISDRAALAGTLAEGNSAAKIQVANNFVALIGSDPNLSSVSYTATPTATGKDVLVSISATVHGLLLPAALTGVSQNDGGAGTATASSSSGALTFTQKSKARQSTTNPQKVCMLSLNTSDADSIYIAGSATLAASGCGVHANSTSSSALHLQGSASATADFFQAVGGATVTGGAASFSPALTSGMDVAANPFSLSISNPGSGNNIQPSNGDSLPNFVYGDITIKNNVTATFTPGIHFITGNIDINNGGELIGTGVTLVLYGPDASITMNGGDLKIQAPTTGAYAGFAVIGNNTATTANTLQGGPSTYLRGIWYTPQSALAITGNSEFNVNSAYFPVVANKIQMQGAAAINIAMDNTAYGYAVPTQLTVPTTKTAYLME